METMDSFAMLVISHVCLLPNKENKQIAWSQIH